MNYSNALSKLYALSPRGIKMGLHRVYAAAERIGNPHTSLNAVQVGGTNGKGTVASLVAHGATASGLRVGLYTSPHLHRFSERIRIDGEEVNSQRLAEHLFEILRLTEGRGAIDLTFFEVATLAALSVFKEQKVDLAVLEVGLGGRLDATSIVPARASAIASIGLDHTEILGETIREITREKVAIARPGAPMVIGPVPEEALREVVEHTSRIGAPLFAFDRDFTLCGELHLPAPGRHFQENGAVALKLFELLRTFSSAISREAFLEAAPTLLWPGRFERILLEREYLLDGAHNLEAASALARAVEGSGHAPFRYLLFGSLRGKPIPEMLETLRPLATEVILAPPPISRARDPVDYAAPGDILASSVEAGLEIIRRGSPESAPVLITGSLFTVAEARRLLLGEVSDPPIGL